MLVSQFFFTYVKLVWYPRSIFAYSDVNIKRRHIAFHQVTTIIQRTEILISRHNLAVQPTAIDTIFFLLPTRPMAYHYLTSTWFKRNKKVSSRIRPWSFWRFIFIEIAYSDGKPWWMPTILSIWISKRTIIFRGVSRRWNWGGANQGVWGRTGMAPLYPCTKSALGHFDVWYSRSIFA